MLYVFFGTDTHTSRENAHRLLSSLREKKPDAAFFTLDSESWNPALFDECLSSSGLFEKKVVVFLNTVFQNPQAKELVIELLESVVSSENIVILLESELDAKTKKTLTEAAEKIVEYKMADEKESVSRVNLFQLTDAFGKRDKKNSWVLYRQALQDGAAPEEIHGLLWWQIKTLLQVAQGETDGLKPFVIGKSKRFLENYSVEELNKLAFELVKSYHQARRGLVDFDLALEKWILQL